jgi:hypothetical protein
VQFRSRLRRRGRLRRCVLDTPELAAAVIAGRKYRDGQEIKQA